ncbi:uncharacterized protein LOC110036780, partial [Phalaenopsis equestris]|uniref:uncharacterized protein LOC110036780 n=1 Tax=Phalaenopsis equestris TaxID=78828 RepID=UPI0009E3F55D
LDVEDDSTDQLVEDAPPEFEEEIKSTIDELKEVNLGTEEHPRPTFISSLLDNEESAELVELLTEFKDCFAWSYDEMPGLSREVAVHKLGIDKDITPIKQAPRRMRLEIEQQVIAEVKKLINAKFIQENSIPHG